MHYSIQQDLARNHLDDLLREASRAHVAALARERRVEETTRTRSKTLHSVLRRLHIPRVRPVPAH
jgi:hypothetical protein